MYILNICIYIYVWVTYIYIYIYIQVFHKILYHLRCIYDINYMVKVNALNMLNDEQYKNYSSNFERKIQ